MQVSSVGGGPPARVRRRCRVDMVMMHIVHATRSAGGRALVHVLREAPRPAAIVARACMIGRRTTPYSDGSSFSFIVARPTEGSASGGMFGCGVASCCQRGGGTQPSWPPGARCDGRRTGPGARTPARPLRLDTTRRVFTLCSASLSFRRVRNPCWPLATAAPARVEVRFGPPTRGKVGAEPWYAGLGSFPRAPRATPTSNK